MHQMKISYDFSVKGGREEKFTPTTGNMGAVTELEHRTIQAQKSNYQRSCISAFITILSFSLMGQYASD
jgi:hypothetical protein